MVPVPRLDFLTTAESVHGRNKRSPPCPQTQKRYSYCESSSCDEDCSGHCGFSSQRSPSAQTTATASPVTRECHRDGFWGRKRKRSLQEGIAAESATSISSTTFEFNNGIDSRALHEAFSAAIATKGPRLCRRTRLRHLQRTNSRVVTNMIVTLAVAPLLATPMFQAAMMPMPQPLTTCPSQSIPELGEKICQMASSLGRLNGQDACEDVHATSSRWSVQEGFRAAVTSSGSHVFQSAHRARSDASGSILSASQPSVPAWFKDDICRYFDLSSGSINKDDSTKDASLIELHPQCGLVLQRSCFSFSQCTSEPLRSCRMVCLLSSSITAILVFLFLSRERYRHSRATVSESSILLAVCKTRRRSGRPLQQRATSVSAVFMRLRLMYKLAPVLMFRLLVPSTIAAAFDRRHADVVGRRFGNEHHHRRDATTVHIEESRPQRTRLHKQLLPNQSGVAFDESVLDPSAVIVSPRIRNVEKEQTIDEFVVSGGDEELIITTRSEKDSTKNSREPEAHDEFITNTIGAATSLSVQYDDPIRERERDALIALYRSTSGSFFGSNSSSSWIYTPETFLDPTLDYCDWWVLDERARGILCSPESRRVTTIKIWGNNLTGSLPSELAHLSELTSLHLVNNAIGGTLPTQLGLLSNSLHIINLSSNKLVGSLPTELTNLSKLTHLYLPRNELSSTLPSELGRLTELQRLDLFGNLNITGTIPHEYGKHWKQMKDLDLRHTSVQGNVTANMMLAIFGNPAMYDASKFSSMGLRLENCVDVSDWVDGATGRGCGWYSKHQQSCFDGEERVAEQVAGVTGEDDVLPVLSASMACCQCGPFHRYYRERGVLRLLHESTGGEHWTNVSIGWGSSTNAAEVAANSPRIGKVGFTGGNAGLTLGPGAPPAVENHCAWSGVRCNDDGAVTHLALVSANLTGTLPLALWTDLPHLIHLEVSNNPNLMGSLPNFRKEQGSEDNAKVLRFLEELNLRNNSFDGVLPDFISQSSLLRKIDLSHNMLSGSVIPLPITRLRLVEELRLSHNALTGTIPPQIQNYARLKLLDLGNNLCVGSIPVELGHLSFLREIRLGNDIVPDGGHESLAVRGNVGLTGALPMEFSDLQYLEVLDVGGNRLRGSLPTELGRLERLKILNVGYNFFTGYIPSQYGELRHVQEMTFKFDWSTITVWENKLKHPAPLSLCFHDSFDLLTNSTWCPPERNALKRLYDATNGAGWTFATNWTEQYNDHCTWHGITCALISNDATSLGTHHDPKKNTTDRNETLTTVVAVSLENNGLWGSIPTQIGQLTSLERLVLSNNRLVSTIPREIVNLERLQYLDLSANALTGRFPREIGVLTSLGHVLLSSNRLTGAVSFTSPHVTQFSVGRRGLDDYANNATNATSVRSFSAVRRFHVAHNSLGGDISVLLDQLRTFPMLTHVDLGFNNFYGDIPPATMHGVDALSVGGNDRLKSPAPSILCHDPNLAFDLRNSPLYCPEVAFLKALHASTNGSNWDRKWDFLDPAVGVCDALWYGIECDEALSVVSIRLAANNLSGTLPPTIGDLARLRVVDLTDNFLIGSVPDTMWSLERLQELRISDNYLTGRIPAIIAAATQLHTISLSSNELSGQIPDQIQNLPMIQRVELASNGFSGTIPSNFHSKLRVLALTDNDFTGDAPLQLCRDNALVFDLQLESAWCTANLYNTYTIFWVSSIAIMCLYISGLVWFASRLWNKADRSVTSWESFDWWAGIEMKKRGRRHLPRRRVNRQQQNLSWREKLGRSLSDVYSRTSANENPITPQMMNIFSSLMLFCQIILAIAGGIASWTQSIVEVSFAISGLLGWHFAMLAWAASLPKKCSQWPFRLSLIFLPPATLVGLLTQEDSDFIDKFFLFLIILYLAWSIPCYLVTKVMQNVMLVESKADGDISAESVNIVKRFIAGLPLVFYFSMKATGNFMKATERKEGELWFHEKHLEGWVSVFSGLVLLLTFISNEVAQVAQLTVEDVIAMKLTWSEFAAAASNFALIAIAIALETVVTRFEGELATAVICALILGPSLQLFSLWAVARDVLRKEHKHLTRRQSFIITDSFVADNHTERLENVSVTVGVEGMSNSFFAENRPRKNGSSSTVTNGSMRRSPTRRALTAGNQKSCAMNSTGRSGEICYGVVEPLGDTSCDNGVQVVDLADEFILEQHISEEGRSTYFPRRRPLSFSSHCRRCSGGECSVEKDEESIKQRRNTFKEGHSSPDGGQQSVSFTTPFRGNSNNDLRVESGDKSTQKQGSLKQENSPSARIQDSFSTIPPFEGDNDDLHTDRTNEDSRQRLLVEQQQDTRGVHSRIKKQEQEANKPHESNANSMHNNHQDGQVEESGQIAGSTQHKSVHKQNEVIEQDQGNRMIQDQRMIIDALAGTIEEKTRTIEEQGRIIQEQGERLEDLEKSLKKLLQRLKFSESDDDSSAR